MLNQGIQLSGENQEFFILGRLQSLRSRLPADFKVRRILDFGCGTGLSTRHLADQFDGAEVLGVDTSENALSYGRRQWGSERVRFCGVEELDCGTGFDLCYVNGVFHHIAVSQRPRAIRSIYRALRDGGRLALFENNPWNPGARLVMKRIPFDRDAQMLSLLETIRLIRAGGFIQPATYWSVFYFPRPLASLRFLEGPLSHLPLGAQYCVQAVK